MRTDKQNPMTGPKADGAQTLRQSRHRRSTARLRLGTTAAAVAGLSATCGVAHAQFVDEPGQAVGVGIQMAMYACSLASIGGNAANIAMNKPQRGWLYTGYICGFMNTLMSPIVLIFFQQPVPSYGITTGILHGVVGATNLGLAIYNGVLWHRARMAGQEPQPPKVAIMPTIGRDSMGGAVYGLSVGLTSF